MKCQRCYGRDYPQKSMRWCTGYWICPDCWKQIGSPVLETYEQVYGPPRQPPTDAEMRRQQEVDDNLAARYTALDRYSGRTMAQQEQWDRDYDLE